MTSTTNNTSVANPQASRNSTRQRSVYGPDAQRGVLLRRHSQPKVERVKAMVVVNHHDDGLVVRCSPEHQTEIRTEIITALRQRGYRVNVAGQADSRIRRRLPGRTPAYDALMAMLFPVVGSSITTDRVAS